MLAISCGDDKSFNRSDNTNPSAPGGLTATGATTTTVNLTWSAATDNTTGIGGVQGCRIFRNGTLAKVTGNVTLVTDDGLTTGTTYTYAIESFDGNGNLSDCSDEVSATTP